MDKLTLTWSKRTRSTANWKLLRKKHKDDEKAKTVIKPSQTEILIPSVSTP